MRFGLIAILVALMMPLICPGQMPKLPPEPTNADRLAALKKARLSFDDALEAVKDHTVDALVFRIELSIRDDKPVYLLRMLIGNPTNHMILNADDGSLIAQGDDGKFNNYGTIYRIRMEEQNIGLVNAIQLAEEAFPEFRAYSSEAVVMGNVIFFEVGMVSPTETKQVTFSSLGRLVKSGPPPTSLGK